MHIQMRLSDGQNLAIEQVTEELTTGSIGSSLTIN